MTNMGSLLREITAPMTVRTHGCLNLESNLISRMKSCLKFACLAAAVLCQGLMYDNIALRLPAAGLRKLCVPTVPSDPRFAINKPSLLRGPNDANDAIDAVGAANVSVPKSWKDLLPPGGITRLTATVVPRYSAFKTRPKVPLPRTSGGWPKESSDNFTFHIASDLWRLWITKAYTKTAVATNEVKAPPKTKMSPQRVSESQSVRQGTQSPLMSYWPSGQRPRISYGQTCLPPAEV
mmetsp:Transcript_3346/g.8038  ORF Transcript_3346/g.8038 Transcript_3346/m.8038 type:complete len:236 (+) Transcript_3346:1311-2018(+)